MATRLQLRKGTTAEHSTFVGADGEVTVDTTKKALVLHDGVTAGGKPLPTLEGGKVPVDQLPEATTTTKGIVQLATQSEVNLGTDETKAITPNTLSGGVRTLMSVTGSAPMYACRAWVCFDSTPTGVVIRASNNIQSIVRQSVGRFVITFIAEMPHSDYIVLTGTRADENMRLATLSLAVNEAYNVGTQNAKTTKTLSVMCGGYNNIYDSYGLSLGVFC